jgi:hypothetical protein
LVCAATPRLLAPVRGAGRPRSFALSLFGFNVGIWLVERAFNVAILPDGRVRPQATDIPRVSGSERPQGGDPREPLCFLFRR